MRKSIQSSQIYLYLYSYSSYTNNVLAKLPYFGELPAREIVEAWWGWADKAYKTPPTKLLNSSNISICKIKNQPIINILNSGSTSLGVGLIGVIRYEIRN